MPPFALEYRLCLNDMALPLVRRAMDFEDIHHLAGGDSGEQDFVCLELKATADVRWLEKAFQLPVRFWKAHHFEVPLLQEMRQAIDSGKVRKGGGSRLPRRPDAVVAIRVRDRVILIQNKTSGLALVSKPDEQRETFQWFLEELQKDLEKLKDQHENLHDQQAETASSSTQPSLRKQKRLASDMEEENIIEAAVTKLREHPLCSRATFLPSRDSFRVLRTDRKSSEIFVPGCRKKRQSAREQQDDEAWDNLRSSFDQGVNLAIEFLAGADSPPVAPICADNDTVEE